ncbi:hypothetical protein DFH11DRAFT_229284 [Phellopilus nigrolimitatus]|nr:hypothetical protein DFH11DRAFT_229284 [Phellopilus nigrolimitatus]
MSNVVENTPLDESALSHDIVRLLGAELQRVKRELTDVQAQAKAQARSTERCGYSREPSNERVTALEEENARLSSKLLGSRAKLVTAREKVTALEEENANLGEKLSGSRVKLETARERKKELKAKIKEMEESAIPTQQLADLDEESEVQKLQKALVLVKSQLTEAGDYVKDLLNRSEIVTLEKETIIQKLKNAEKELGHRGIHDPRKYIIDLPKEQDYDDSGSHHIKPFSKCSAAELVESTKIMGKDFSTALLHCEDARYVWSDKRPAHGILIEAPFIYQPCLIGDAHSQHTQNSWLPRPSHSGEGTKQLFIQRNGGFWYYCGTYKLTYMKCPIIFHSLPPMVKAGVLTDTIAHPDHVPPIVKDTIQSLYCGGVLQPTCVVHERIGFNAPLQQIFINLASGLNGPAFTFSPTLEPCKRKAEETLEIPHQSGPVSKRSKNQTVR